jgi:hypothetical protein
MTDLEVRSDWPAVLSYLGLNPANPESKALMLVCQRYGLDPLLGHVRILQMAPYITRDGMIDIAHRSGQLDGIVVDELRRSSDDSGWTAYVAVWRKDMSHPFRYGARCRDNERQGREGLGPEMATARAERRALKRAFRIATSDEYQPDAETVRVEPAAADAERPLPALDSSPFDPEPAEAPQDEAEVEADYYQQMARREVGTWADRDRARFAERHDIADLAGDDWPESAIADALAEV